MVIVFVLGVCAVAGVQVNTPFVGRLETSMFVGPETSSNIGVPLVGRSVT